MTGSKLHERLAREPILCAEGYRFELERRGYLQAGAYVPEVVLDRPEAVDQLHREFVDAGSDVVEAFTYHGHREKLRRRTSSMQRNVPAPRPRHERIRRRWNVNGEH